MLILKPSDIAPSEITSPDLYRRRRDFLRLGAAGALIGTGIGAGLASRAAQAGETLPGVRPGPFGTDESRTSYKDVTGYNNFYEFGTDKADPAKRAASLVTRPWTVTVEGLVRQRKTFGIEELLKLAPLEERIYRLRCVEGWSMVIPWVGFPLAALLKRVEPLGSAKFVEFATLHNPAQMPGQRSRVLEWPYIEGLRLDEARHPLAILAVGLYGEVLPNQNGAPIRLVVPWKYGFKSIKSIVRIRLVERQPVGSWEEAIPQEYGFYSNVNPAVEHPRWSQATERRIGEFRRRPTQPFNGYGEQVASLYAGMDLKKHY